MVRTLLCLPIIATMTNLILALVILHRSSTSAKGDGIPAQHERAVHIDESSDVLVPAARIVCDTADSVTDSCSPSEAPPLSNDVEDIDHHHPTVLFENDPNMKSMPTVPEFKAYVRPHVSSFYQEESRTRMEVKPSFSGLAGKFINMSPEKLDLYWEPGEGKPGHFQGSVGPFQARGTGTYPSHQFSFRSSSHSNEAICRFTVTANTSIYFYDPFATYSGDSAAGWCAPLSGKLHSLDQLSTDDRVKYNKHWQNNEFAKKYRDFTGADWLSMYPRSRPRNDMWRADFFGQEHFVTTKETQFQELPPSSQLGVSGSFPRGNQTEQIPFQAYRGPSSTASLTLKAVSCAPRAFEMKVDGENFLSSAEVEHILSLAKAQNLARSTVGHGRGGTDSTRTSFNTWLYREASPVIDAIYRRVADALQIDEALLRQRELHEHPEWPGSRSSLAEAMQLVHYDVGQEYTAHHDFGYPTNIEGDHSSRWANILFYLNEGMEGGETSFPRWRNAETSGPMNVKPEKGKAVLFYMLLPDGNLDDLTQHAALPIQKGEKWLANLWIWDPVRG
mmetsp:Transcript_24176/g.44743  ORF Transcript_24176/g.44743 Transcript_24176/m.44743 type:complete len:560 (-) Transcript_24176:372-2051(-)